MLIMTSLSSTFLTGEDEEEEEEEERLPSEDDVTPTQSHRRRWSSTPIDSCGESLQSFTLVRSNSAHVNFDSGVNNNNLDEFLSCSSDNSYSFYPAGKISPWGPSGPPLLTESSRSNAPQPPQQRRGRSVTRMMKRDLPPFLTTLDCNGRPRFHHRRVRSEGRLEIASVAVDLPEIVSVRGREGLRIGTVRISQQDQQNH